MVGLLSIRMSPILLSADVMELGHVQWTEKFSTRGAFLWLAGNWFDVLALPLAEVANAKVHLHQTINLGRDDWVDGSECSRFYALTQFLGSWGVLGFANVCEAGTI